MPYELKPVNEQETTARQIAHFVTLADMARIMGMTKSGAYKYVRRHQIPVIKVGNTLLVRRRDIPVRAEAGSSGEGRGDTDEHAE